MYYIERITDKSLLDNTRIKIAEKLFLSTKFWLNRIFYLQRLFIKWNKLQDSFWGLFFYSISSLQPKIPYTWCAGQSMNLFVNLVRLLFHKYHLYKLYIYQQFQSRLVLVKIGLLISKCKSLRLILKLHRRCLCYQLQFQFVLWQK